MEAEIFLIRHAPHGDLDKRLTGRGDTPLSAEGRRAANEAGRSLPGTSFFLIFSSPMARARETAETLFRGRREDVRCADALSEIDFGDWTGRDFDELETDADWRRWNTSRAASRARGGETMRAAQTRASRFVQETGRRHPGRRLAMVSHADIIRAVICDLLRLSLDRILSFEVAPLSVSRVAIGPESGRILSLNESAS